MGLLPGWSKIGYAGTLSSIPKSLSICGVSLDHLSPLLEEAYLYKGYGGRVGAKVDALMRSSLERLERQGRLLSLEGWSLRPDHSARNWMHVDDLDPEERKWRGL